MPQPLTQLPTLPTEQINAPVQNAPEVVIEKAGFVARAAAVVADSFIIYWIFFCVGYLGKQSGITQWIDLIILLIYSVLAIGLYGKTIGKKAFGLKVVNYENGNPGFGKAILREVLGKLISSFIFDLGFLWVIWDKNRQGWHDKIAKTYVVQEKPLRGFMKGFAYFIVLGLPVLAILGIIVTVVLIVFGRLGHPIPQQPVGLPTLSTF